MRTLPHYLSKQPLNPSVVRMPWNLGQGLANRIARKRAALIIELLLVHRIEYKRARERVKIRMARLTNAQAKREAAKERMISERVCSAVMIQKLFRGFLGRLTFMRHNMSKHLANRLSAHVCNVTSLIKKVESIWKQHRGFLGQVLFSAEHIFAALAKRGRVTMELKPSADPREPSQVLVGGCIRLSFTLVPSLIPSCSTTTNGATNRSKANLNKDLIVERTFCIHESITKEAALLKPVSIVKLQLAGLQRYSEEICQIGFSGAFLGRVYLSSKLVAESRYPLPNKLEACFEDEVLYLPLDAIDITSGSPVFKLELWSIPGAQKYAGSAYLGSLCLNPASLLQSLGSKTVWDVRTTSNTPKGESFKVGLLLGVEAPARTESRTMAEEIVEDLLGVLGRVLDSRAPRLNVRAMVATFCDVRVGEGARLVTCKIYLNHAYIGQTGHRREVGSMTIIWGEEFNIPVVGQEENMLLVLRFISSIDGKEEVIGTSQVPYAQLYQPTSARLKAEIVRKHDSGGSLATLTTGCVSMDIQSLFVPPPGWRKRLYFAEKVVGRYIEEGARRISQPRIEFCLQELVDFKTDAKNLKAVVYWNGKFKGVIDEKRGQRTQKLVEGEGEEVVESIPFAENKNMLFFPANHDWGQGSLPLAVTIQGNPPGTKELVDAGALSFFLDEIFFLPQHRQAIVPVTLRRGPDFLGVARRLGGVALCSIMLHDIHPSVYRHLHAPCPRLCLNVLDIRQSNSEEALNLLGLYVVVHWKGYPITRTALSTNPVKATWANEVFDFPMISEDDNPVSGKAVDLSLHIYKHCGEERPGVLIGHVVPFDGTRPYKLPISYYPFPVLQKIDQGSSEMKTIGLLGLGFSIYHPDHEIPENAETPCRRVSDVDISQTNDNSLLGSANYSRSLVGGERLSVLSALKKTAELAGEMWGQAREAAERNPKDR